MSHGRGVVRFHLDSDEKSNGHAANGNGLNGGHAVAAPAIPGQSASPAPAAPGGPGVDGSISPPPGKKQSCLDSFLGRGGPDDESIDAPPPKVKKRKLKPGEEPQKRFYFRLDKIQATFELQMDKCFLEFEFGGVYETEKTETGDSETKTRKVKGQDGKEKEEEYQERIMLNRIKIKKPRADVYFTRIKTNVKPKVKVQFHDHSCEGYWEGPYSDLDRENITVRLWHYGGVGEPNHLIGHASEKLKEIVASKIDRELRVLKYVPGSSSSRKETMARLTYKLEFQEDYKYNIRFLDWELKRIHEPIYPEVPERRWCGCMIAGERKLTFDIVQSRQGWGSWLIAGAKALFNPFRGEQRWENRCELPIKKEGTSGRKFGIIKYPGTRAWLEDESLSITLTKNLCCCIPITIGRKAEELQGVLDYGHIDTVIEVKENVNLLNCCPLLLGMKSGGGSSGRTQTFKIAGTVDSSGMNEGEDLPIFRQLGNADPSSDGLLQQEGATFLVIKVIRAKGLTIPSRDEFKETLDPSATVYWNGMQKTTRIQRATCDPFWDDEVHFKIMDRHTLKKKAPKKYEDFNEVTRSSRIEILVWDNDGLAGRTALGKCYVDFYDIYFKRQHRKIVSFASNGRQVERLVYLSGEKSLEAPFATDGAERKARNGKGGTQEEERKEEFNTRFVEFLVYFDRKDNNPIPLINKKQKDKEVILQQKLLVEKKHGGEPLTIDAIRSGRAYWDRVLADVLDRQKRFFPFYGIDEYSGTYHFLPSFLKPMQPPAEVRAIGTLAFYVYAIECIRKPEPYIDPLKDSTQPPRGDVWTWADPYFFLEKRKGDVKDHALMLCNFLLGLGMDAYVCIGSARTKNRVSGSQRQPHFWVMTREEVELTEEEEKEKRAGGKNAKSGKEFIVRFWETSNGRTYTIKGIVTEPPADRRGKKYLEQPDVKPVPINEETFKKMREEQAEHERQVALGIAPAPNADGELEPGAEPGAQDGSGAAVNGDDAEGSPLASPSAASSGTGGKSSDGPKLGRIEIDGAMRANLSAKELLQLELHNHQTLLDEEFEQALRDEGDDIVLDGDLLTLSLGKDSLPLGGATYASASSSSASSGGANGNEGHLRIKAELDEKSDAESQRSVFEEERKAKMEQIRQEKKEQRDTVANLEDPTLKQQKKRLQQQCPYASIDIVFNHKHLYANLQPQDPELIFFDLESHPSRWCEFEESQYRQYLGIKHLKEFYPDKGLASVKAPQRDAEELEAQLIALIKDTIQTHRKYPSGNSRPSMDTEFIKRFEFQIDENTENKDNTALAHILKRLDMEHAISLQPQELLPLIKSRGGFVEPLNYDYVDKEWRKKVLQDLPAGYTYREESLLLKHSDQNRIAAETIRRCHSMIETSEFRKPRFAVGCRLYRMAASVCPVRVFVCVVAKDA